jgi:hypothetical protein
MPIASAMWSAVIGIGVAMWMKPLNVEDNVRASGRAAVLALLSGGAVLVPFGSYGGGILILVGAVLSLPARVFAKRISRRISFDHLKTKTQ